VYPRWISRIGAPLIAFVLTVAPSVSTVHAVEDARKVSVVSFGLFGDQGVFRSEATGAARVVAGGFGSAPINAGMLIGDTNLSQRQREGAASHFGMRRRAG
jgi:Zn-dependent alcohol dehydrogenase